MATLSIVTVTLNEEKNLPLLLDSLRSQTDIDFNLIVVDGASKDGTIELLRGVNDLELAWISEPDFGFYDALNKALRLVRTDFYLVVGADDQLEPTAVANFKSVATTSNADLVIAAVRMHKHCIKGYHPKRRWLGPPSMYTSHSVGTLIRTSLHQQFGYYSAKYSILADSLFLKRVMISNETSVIEGDFVAGTFSTDGFSSTDIARSICELWMVQRETGENQFLQFILFQLRLIWNIGRILRR